jgi:hypothetical protein
VKMQKQENADVGSPEHGREEEHAFSWARRVPPVLSTEKECKNLADYTARGYTSGYIANPLAAVHVNCFKPRMDPECEKRFAMHLANPAAELRAHYGEGSLMTESQFKPMMTTFVNAMYAEMRSSMPRRDQMDQIMCNAEKLMQLSQPLVSTYEFDPVRRQIVVKQQDFCFGAWLAAIDPEWKKLPFSNMICDFSKSEIAAAADAVSFGNLEGYGGPRGNSVMENLAWQAEQDDIRKRRARRQKKQFEKDEDFKKRRRAGLPIQQELSDLDSDVEEEMERRKMAKKAKFAEQAPEEEEQQVYRFRPQEAYQRQQAAKLAGKPMEKPRKAAAPEKEVYLFRPQLAYQKRQAEKLAAEMAENAAGK